MTFPDDHALTANTNPELSIIVPVLNEIDQISANIAKFQCLLAVGVELIFADGGSTDGTVEALRKHRMLVLESPRGRALQMNYGAAQARGRVLLFLHVDSVLPNDFSPSRLCAQVAARSWGFFPVELTCKYGVYVWIARGINFRARLFRVGTGDQGLFISAELFATLGGYKNIPLMEDIELSRRLKKISAPIIQSEYLITSARRWQHRGVIKTILLMWSLQLAFKLGVPAQRLHRWYYS